MGYQFTQWGSENGIMQAGSIYRVGSSDQKVWGEENKTDLDLQAGTFVAVNPEGGVQAIAASTDLVSGIVVRDIYGDTAPNKRQSNIGHFSHGDGVVALVAKDITLTRGDRVFVVASGDDAGKITNVEAGNINLGYWVERVSNGNSCAAITLGYAQSVAATVKGAKA